MTQTARPGLLAPGRRGPALIAHAAGNAREAALRAAGEDADYLEVDLWVHQGHFEARHERRTYGMPLLFEKWYLRFAPRRPFGLAELLRETTPETAIFLDLKNGGRRAAELVRRSLDAAPARRVMASSQLWPVLRHLHREVPEAGLFYSIDVPAKLDLFLAVSARDVRPRGVSCRHSLLDPDVIAALHARDLLVVAWTVDDLDRAAELAEWGVDGITTHRVRDVRERLGDDRG